MRNLYNKCDGYYGKKIVILYPETIIDCIINIILVTFTKNYEFIWEKRIFSHIFCKSIYSVRAILEETKYPDVTCAG